MKAKVEVTPGPGHAWRGEPFFVTEYDDEHRVVVAVFDGLGDASLAASEWRNIVGPGGGTVRIVWEDEVPGD